LTPVLIWLSSKSPRFIFALAWTAILIDGVFALSPFWPLRLIGSAIGIAIVFGYPFLIVFGFPPPYSNKTSKRISALSLAVLAGICITSEIDPKLLPTISPPWARTLVGIPLICLVFSPFFIATTVLGRTRRALGAYKPLDSVASWLSLFYFAFGGVFFVHGRMSSAFGAVRAESITVSGR
jgi:hypothetical protein